MAELRGYPQLQARLRAIGNQSAGKRRMAFIADIAVGRMKLNIPHKTSNTSRSIHPESVTETSARIVASKVAGFIDEGTGLYGPFHHVITPRAKKALAFYRGTFGKGGSLRLTGRPRKGKAGQTATLVIVRSVKGMRPRPFIQRSVREASEKVGTKLLAEVIHDWNGAA